MKRLPDFLDTADDESLIEVSAKELREFSYDSWKKGYAKGRQYDSESRMKQIEAAEKRGKLQALTGNQSRP